MNHPALKLPPQLAWIACGLVPGVVYLATLAPSLCGGDGGELAVVAARLEVAHPPGYPLYTLLAWPFAQLGWGTLAWRLALLSAVSEAVAVGLLAASIGALTGRRLIAVALAWLYAFSPLVWQWATEAEVFALHHLFLALGLWITVTGSVRGPSLARSAALGVTLGLGMSHHHTILFFALPAVVYALATSLRRADRWQLLGVLAGSALLGLVPYVYLPLAGRSASLLSMGDPTTLDGFVHHVLRRDYGTFQLAHEASGMASTWWARFSFYVASFGRATLYVFAPLALVGLITAWRRGGAGRVVAVAFVLYGFGFTALASFPLASELLHTVLARFFPHGHLLGWVLVAFGIERLMRRPRAVMAASFAAVGVAVLASVPPVRADHVAALGRVLLAEVPPGSVLLTRGDLATNAVRYVQVADGVGIDRIVLDQELLTRPWYVARARGDTGLALPGALYHPRVPGGFHLAAFVEANRSRRVFVFPEVKPGDISLNQAYALVPKGLVREIVPLADLASHVDGDPLVHARAAPRPPESVFGPDTWEATVRAQLDEAFSERGRWLLERAIAAHDDPVLLGAARAALLEAQARQGDGAPWQLHKNLGLAAARLVPFDPAAAPGAINAWQIYLDRAPANEPDRAAIAAAVSALTEGRALR